MNDAELARLIAAAAGQLLADLRHTELFRGEVLGRLGDRLANEFIMAAPGPHRPDDAILSEEGADAPARLEANRVWIVDPLDGTREYGEGRADWAVHVGLAVAGTATVGAVALPGLPLTLSSADALVPPRRSGGRLRMLVRRTPPAREAPPVAAPPAPR